MSVKQQSSSDSVVNKEKVGSNLKAKDTCGLYEPHTMNDELFQFIQGVDYEIVATGCSSCGGAEVDLTYTQQHDHADRIYLNFDDIDVATDVAERAEDAGLSVDWDGTEMKAVGVGA